MSPKSSFVITSVNENIILKVLLNNLNGELGTEYVGNQQTEILLDCLIFDTIRGTLIRSEAMLQWAETRTFKHSVTSTILICLQTQIPQQCASGRWTTGGTKDKIKSYFVWNNWRDKTQRQSRLLTSAVFCQSTHSVKQWIQLITDCQESYRKLQESEQARKQQHGEMTEGYGGTKVSTMMTHGGQPLD